MNTSLNWLNRYLDRPVTVDEAEHALTHAGFPLESREPRGGDWFMDVEITSNRGDCLCHVGLAREVAASTGRMLLTPEVPQTPGSGRVGDVLRLENRVPEACPRFTARVVRGVKVGPSPKWLVDLLEAVGQRSINNVVDVTNWLNFEMGHPAHVFDLAKLRGGALVVRWAHDGEKLRTLDGKERTLRSDELVVADAERATSLAGVIGGGESEVGAGTQDVVLEVATWDPLAVRRAARRHGVRTDASYRFERGVCAHNLERASARAMAMLVELAGGTPCEGVLIEGRELAAAREVALRPERARAIIGVDIDDAEQERLLSAHGVSVVRGGGALACTIPAHRLDLEREIDLIEEIARTKGLDAITVRDRVGVRVHKPQDSERAMREMARVLTGMGFYEAITFSFVTGQQAGPFLAAGMRAVSVDEERRKGAPTLRPSVIPSLLACRRANQDARTSAPGGVRLYETSAVFAEKDDDTRTSMERRVLAMLMDVPGEGRKRSVEDRQRGLRIMRGAIDEVVRAMAGEAARVEVVVGDASASYESGASARIELVGANGSRSTIGGFGLVSGALLKSSDLETPVVVAELDLDALVAMYPPKGVARELPQFPGIERDLSLVVDEGVAWSRIEGVLSAESVALMEGWSFVGTFRGAQVGEGKKSVTLRLSFRDPSRTLRHEEVDPQVGSIMGRMERELGATLRA
ncbi:MAG: phenylalanine--tRNA ligase subunit beta [Phycisphaerales bacterium]|jgi:phenylalanyl-tRNA synthetase beta chain|nr:phenylalanine--tRNA ligase subunit beta [Phycisphaerales bacterium]